MKSYSTDISLTHGLSQCFKRRRNTVLTDRPPPPLKSLLCQFCIVNHIVFFSPDTAPIPPTLLPFSAPILRLIPGEETILTYWCFPFAPWHIVSIKEEVRVHTLSNSCVRPLPTPLTSPNARSIHNPTYWCLPCALWHSVCCRHVHTQEAERESTLSSLTAAPATMDVWPCQAAVEYKTISLCAITNYVEALHK